MKQLFLVSLVLSLFSTDANAVGGIVHYLPKGVLVIKSKSGDKTLKEKDSIPSGATVAFKDGETAIIKLEDGSLIKLKGNSEITLATDPTPTVELSKGAAFAQVNPPTDKKRETLSKPRFMMRSHGVVMGVRGTEFFTALGPKDHVWMCVGHGVVEAGKIGEKEKVTVKEGEGILVEKEKKIEPPKAYEWTKKLNWNMDPNAGETKDDSKIEAEYGNLLRQTYD